MDRISEIKNQARITIDSPLGTAQSERAKQLKFQIKGLIDEAYVAGKNDLLHEVLSKGRTLGGQK
ncbi:hypothetical protein GNF18_10300 [Ligilactobacillus pobuzihii]|uniref:hypothetical protein n=1 Tax=Ligilactobacillus pobuzihii TaxID=449659 RepID=UPI0019D0494B|nr:hypothetical protein [Ligilactobacillus pobuzihii]MBN7275531.1 hypothetical protein [Ligilactobacillus pobuzihii]